MFPEASPLKNEPFMGWVTATAGSYSNSSKGDQRNVALWDLVASLMFPALVFLIIVGIFVHTSTQGLYTQSL